MDKSALQAFLDRELLALTLAATSQRSDLYASDLTEIARRPFQRSLRAALRRIVGGYKTAVSDGTHIENIQTLAAELSAAHGDLLASGQMKFGHSQKALNLYLKYLWCLDRIQEPPHFPIDSIILQKVPAFRTFRWTRMENKQQYVAIIEAAREQAKKQGLSLARWELKEYKRRDD